MTQEPSRTFGGAGSQGGVRVHLASRSPRRRELLRGAGIEHEASHPGVDDGLLSPGNVSPESWVMALAYLKASTSARGCRDVMAEERHAERGGTQGGPRCVVLGADTVVVHHGAMMGQPADEADARRMLLAMRDDVHDVVTGVALVDPATGRRELFVDRAVVRVGHISDQEIERYLATGGWRGKAGAYNLSERLDAGWPIEYEGDPGTIMGLPMRKLTGRLAAFVAAG